MGIPFRVFRVFRGQIKVLTGMPKTETAIRDLADKLEIAPGIIVGRLQNEGLLRWGSVLNKSLKVSYEWRDGG